MGLCQYDLATKFKHAFGLVPAGRLVGAANGTAVDFAGCSTKIYSRLMVGAVTGTDPTLDVAFEESDDNSSFTSVASANHTQVTASTANELISFTRTKRYVRPVVTITEGDEMDPVTAVSALLLTAEKHSF